MMDADIAEKLGLTGLVALFVAIMLGAWAAFPGEMSTAHRTMAVVLAVFSVISAVTLFTAAIWV